MQAGWRALFNRGLLHPLAKPLGWLLALAPLAWLMAGAVNGRLGANPAEALIRGSGDWALRLLCLALAVTPLREALGLVALARWRRLVGLFAAFYAGLHFLAYAWLDQGLVWPDILRDIAKRPFILVGSAALLLLLPLVATSTHRAQRALGARRWQVLHRSVHAVALLALLHFFWMRAGKNDFAEWSVYAVLLAGLLGWRLLRRRRQRRESRVRSSRTATLSGQSPHG